MTHPILALQANAGRRLARQDGLAVFDAPRPGRAPPYVAIARHDVLPRDGDAAPGHEHRLLLHAWTAEPSRKSAVALADEVVSTALGGGLDSDDAAGDAQPARAHRHRHRAGFGRARAAIALTFYSEPKTP